MNEVSSASLAKLPCDDLANGALASSLSFRK